jgi:hypothetical protein
MRAPTSDLWTDGGVLGARGRTNGGRTGGPWRDARPASVGAPRGVRELQGRPRGTRRLGKARDLGRHAAQTPKVAGGEGAVHTGAPARQRRDAARFRRICFILGHFEHVFLPIFEQKCTRC